jgi:hypothetical protein
MHTYPACGGGLRRGAQIALLGGLLALDLAFAPGSDAAAPDDREQSAIVAEFNRICSELSEARSRLGAGTMTDDEFAGTVLDLFVRADSVSLRVPRGGWIQGSGSGKTFALSRALQYLIGSLRGNYVGIAARDGVQFLEADRAYQAAVAWRSNIEVATAPAAH